MNPYHATVKSPKLRRLGQRVSSLVVLLQKSPYIQILLPEAKLFSSIATADAVKMTIATVAGLGVFDSVSGASEIIQISPVNGSNMVPATTGENLSFNFQAVSIGGETLKSFTVTGTLPPGLTLTPGVQGKKFGSITGMPTQAGSYPDVQIHGWGKANGTGRTVRGTFTFAVAQGTPLPAGIVTQPSAITIDIGDTTELVVVADGTAPFTYQWYQGPAGNTSSPVGTNSSAFTTPALSTTTNYWVNVANAQNPSGADSNAATVTVFDPEQGPTIINQHPASIRINSGETTSLSATSYGAAPITYQWYQGPSGVVTTPVGTNSSSFTTPVLSASTQYWVKATNADNPNGANSNAATVTVFDSQIDSPLEEAGELVRNPVSFSVTNAGKYAGFLRSSSGEMLGYFKSVKVGKTGKFSAKVYWGSVVYAVKGTLDEQGAYSGVITPRSGSAATVELQLVSTLGGGYEITGSVTVGNETADVVAVRSGATPQQAGLYTLLIIADEGDSNAPQGQGYGLMKVSTKGSAKIKGLLGDGSKWTAKCSLTPNGKMPLYYTKSVILSGLVRFRDVEEVSDCDAALMWRRAGSAVTLSRNLIGSRFRYTGGRLLSGLSDTTTNVEMQTGAGDSAEQWHLAWSTTNKLTYAGPEKIKMKPSTKSGQIKGKIPTGGINWKVEGVVFQKQNLAAGLMTAKGASAQSLLIVPAEE